MNLRDLRYICAVADFGQFGRAADSVHVSQPTLSGQVRKLEEELGVTLFERTSKSVRVTPVGERIIAAAREVLLGAEQIERIAEAAVDPEAGPLGLGLIPTIAPYLIPLFVRPLKDQLPDLSPVFVEEITDGLLHRLIAGDLDAAIIATAPDVGGVHALPLYREPFWLAVPRGHPLEHAGPVTTAQLDLADLLLLADGHCLRDQTLAAFRGAPAAGRADTTATSLETIVNLVAAGHGITLVPALAMRGGWTTDQGVVCLPLRGDTEARTVRLVYRKGFPRRALLQRVASIIRDALPNTVTALS